MSNVSNDSLGLGSYLATAGVAAAAGSLYGVAKEVPIGITIPTGKKIFEVGKDGVREVHIGTELKPLRSMTASIDEFVGKAAMKAPKKFGVKNLIVKFAQVMKKTKGEYKSIGKGYFANSKMMLKGAGAAAIAATALFVIGKGISSLFHKKEEEEVRS